MPKEIAVVVFHQTGDIRGFEVGYSVLRATDGSEHKMAMPMSISESLAEFLNAEFEPHLLKDNA